MTTAVVPVVDSDALAAARDLFVRLGYAINALDGAADRDALSVLHRGIDERLLDAIGPEWATA